MKKESKMVWFRVGDLRGLPGKIINENVFDMGYMEIEVNETHKKYLVTKNEIMEDIVSYDKMKINKSSKGIDMAKILDDNKTAPQQIFGQGKKEQSLELSYQVIFSILIIIAWCVFYFLTYKYEHNRWEQRYDNAYKYGYIDGFINGEKNIKP